MEIKNLENKVLYDLEKSKSFNKVFDAGNTIVLIHNVSAHVVCFTKNQEGLYNASFSRHDSEIKHLLEKYKK